MRNTVAFTFSIFMGYACMATAASTKSTAYGCSFGDDWTSEAGFNINVYSYTPHDTAYLSSTFMAYGYTSNELLDSNSGIIDPYFSFSFTQLGISSTQTVINGATREEYWSSAFGMYFTVSNAVLEYTGYFRAPKSGIYEFDLQDMDDGAMVFFGEGASDCCTDKIEASSADEYLMYVTRPLKAGTRASSNPGSSAHIYLEEGYIYPLRIVYVNIIGFGQLDFSVTLPDGTAITDFTDYILQIYGGSGCGAVTVSMPTTTEVFSVPTTYTTYTTYTVEGSTYTNDLVVVGKTIEPITTTSITSWNNTYTSTSTSSTYTNISGVFIPEEVQLIEVPATHSSTYTTAETSGSYSSIKATDTTPVTSITVVPWTNNYTSTHTTVSLVTGSGASYSEYILILDTPEFSTATYAGSAYITISTATSAGSGYTTTETSGSASNIKATDTTPVTSTTVVPWSNKYTSTHTTVSLVTESGASYYEDVVIVYAPTRALSSVTIPGTASSTYTQTITSGTSVYVTAVVVDVTPAVSIVSIPWSKSYVSTYTSQSVVSSDGSIFNENIVVVETPTATASASDVSTVTETISITAADVVITTTYLCSQSVTPTLTLTYTITENESSPKTVTTTYCPGAQTQTAITVPQRGNVNPSVTSQTTSVAAINLSTDGFRPTSATEVQTVSLFQATQETIITFSNSDGPNSTAILPIDYEGCAAQRHTSTLLAVILGLAIMNAV